MAEIFLKKRDLIQTHAGLRNIIKSLHFVKDNQDLFLSLFPLARPLYESVLTQQQETSIAATKKSLKILLSQIGPISAPIFNLNESLMNDLIFFISDKANAVHLSQKYSVQSYCLKLITPEFMKVLNTRNQEELFGALFRFSSGENKALVRKIFTQLYFPPKLFIDLLETKSLRIPEEPKHPKRRREETPNDKVLIGRINSVLELLTEGETMTNFPTLCPTFIKVMNKLDLAEVAHNEAEGFQNDDRVQVLDDSIEYTKQLLLNLMDRTLSPAQATNYVASEKSQKKRKTENLNNVFNSQNPINKNALDSIFSQSEKEQLVDTIIECAKKTRNPQTRNRAISFLSLIWLRFFLMSLFTKFYPFSLLWDQVSIFLFLQPEFIQLKIIKKK